MSAVRRLNRENKRRAQKYGRQVDWTKVRKAVKTLLIVCLGSFAIIFSVTFFAVNSHNSIRKTVSSNPATTTGKVISIASGKGVHSATYEFTDKERKYTGATFTSYKGVVGDSICIEFSVDKPNINLFCDDIVMENIFNDSFLFSLEMFVIIFGFTLLFLIWKILTNDKKIIVELTSRKNNYR